MQDDGVNMKLDMILSNNDFNIALTNYVKMKLPEYDVKFISFRKNIYADNNTALSMQGITEYILSVDAEPK